ncbi:MAG TPA: NIPSNAP family protein [Terriglobia bacterium]|nr:NIPSNAP family protein [Terriglobia bacterium]
MQRRHFLASSIAASTLAAGASVLGNATGSDAAGESGREYYELRQYRLRSGPQARLTGNFLRNALLPALGRLGIGPVGVFNQLIGPENPSIYVLMPSSSLKTLVTVEASLAQDSAYQEAGKAFLSAPAESPAFVRMESKLMIAFEGRPRLTLPPQTAGRSPRVFELRTYESPSDRDHIRKVEMFHHGEFDIFRAAGFYPVFYGDTLIGARMPNLTYMLAFDSLDERNRLWDAFQNAPAWKKLTGSPRYNYESIVTNVTNLIVGPTPYSEI